VLSRRARGGLTIRKSKPKWDLTEKHMLETVRKGFHVLEMDALFSLHLRFNSFETKKFSTTFISTEITPKTDQRTLNGRSFLN
jgi:hypothetical protein